MVSCVRSAALSAQLLARRAANVGCGLGLTLLLAGCGDTSIGSSFMNWIPKPAATDSADPNAGKDVSKYLVKATCPNAEIRYGTESMMIYDKNKPGDDTAVKYQVNVQRVARDCDEVAESIVARVGVAGLIVGGPKGTAGKVDVPIRIAAVSGDKVLFTELKVVSVQVEAPDFNGNWSLVDQITIPSAGSADTIIYVGLDDKNKGQKPVEAKPRPHKARPPSQAADPNDPYPQMKPNIPQ